MHQVLLILQAACFAISLLTSAFSWGAALAAVVLVAAALVTAALAAGELGSTETVGCAVLVLVLATSRALVSCSTWLRGAPEPDGWPAGATADTATRSVH